MFDKIIDRMHAMWWNLVSITLGMVLIWAFHAFLFKLVGFCKNTNSLIHDVTNELEFQRSCAIKITKSGKEIQQSFELSTEVIDKQELYSESLFLIGFMILITPMILAVFYLFFIKLSTLAVNRNYCLLIIMLLGIIMVSYNEFNHLKISGDGTEFMFSGSISIIIIGAIVLFTSMSPYTKVSPYYRSENIQIVV